MKTLLQNLAMAFSFVSCAVLVTPPAATAQQVIDFRDAVRTAEPALFTIHVDANQDDRIAENPNQLDQQDVESDPLPETGDDSSDTAAEERRNTKKSKGPQIEFFDLDGRPLAPGQAVRPRQRLHARVLGLQRRFANGNLQTTKSAAFAIDDTVLIGYVGRDVDSVTVLDSVGNELQGKVETYDHVTGLAAIRLTDPVTTRLVISAAKPEPGQAVVATWRDNHLHADAGMISTHMISNDSGIGLASKIDFGSNTPLVGSPVLDGTGILIGTMVPSKTGRLALVDASLIRRLAESVRSGSPTNLKRGLVGIQFEGGGPLVLQVSPDSGAANAGIQAGDLIEKVGDYEIHDALDVVSSVASARAGDTIELVVRRDQQQLTIPVTLSEHPQQHPDHLLSQNAIVPLQNGFELKDGKLVPLQGGDFFPPEMFGDGEIPMDEVFPPIELPQGPNSPRWRFPLNGRINGMQFERSDMQETLEELKRQLEQLNKKFDEKN